MDDATQRQLDHIKEIAVRVRTTWFTLLFALTFAGITLLGVEHADFYAFGRQTELPLVGVSIPTTSFFAAAPALITALYVYLHLQLMQLWQALDPERIPPTVLGRPLGSLAHPGLIVDHALRTRADGSAERHALAWLGSAVVLLLVWLFAPVVLALFWWQSMPARDEALTVALWVMLSVATWVGLASLWRAGTLARPHTWRLWRRLLRYVGLAVTLAWLVPVLVAAGIQSYSRTKGDVDWAVAQWNAIMPASRRYDLPVDASARGDATNALPLRAFRLAPIDLVGEALIPRPVDWLDHAAAREAFFDDWCARKRNEACEWEDEGQSGAFERAWQTRRDATLANLPTLEHQGADLREARLTSAFLPRVDLRRAQLEGAQLEGAAGPSCRATPRRATSSMSGLAGKRRLRPLKPRSPTGQKTYTTTSAPSGSATAGRGCPCSPSPAIRCPSTEADNHD